MYRLSKGLCGWNPALLEMQIVRVESVFLSNLPGLREHCVQGNVMLMSIVLLPQSFIQIILTKHVCKVRP